MKVVYKAVWLTQVTTASGVPGLALLTGNKDFTVVKLVHLYKMAPCVICCSMLESRFHLYQLTFSERFRR